MLILIVLILLTIFLYIRIKKILYKNFIKIKNNCEEIKNRYDILLEENTKLKTDNFNLENIAEQTIALFDITKNICKSLEEDKVFSIFRDEINKYIEIGDCEFFKNAVDSLQYKDYTVVSLNIDKNPVGYLVAKGIKEEDKDKFHILTQQFILAIKRALLYQRVQELAITDSLTSVFSRRYCLERFNEEVERSKRFNYKLACLMVDID